VTPSLLYNALTTSSDGKYAAYAHISDIVLLDLVWSFCWVPLCFTRFDALSEPPFSSTWNARARAYVSVCVRVCLCVCVCVFCVSE